MEILKNQKNLILDSVSAAIVTQKKINNEKEEKEFVEKAHRANISSWMNDMERVRLFKESNYELINDSLICMEVCTSYLKDDTPKTLIYDSQYNLSVSEELTLTLFPFVKDLSNGDIYTISDSFTMKQINPAYAEWYNISTEKPSYREEIPAPHKYRFFIDEAWNNNRFFIDKVKQYETPNEYFTFIVPRSVLQTKVKNSVSNVVPNNVSIS